MTHFNIDHRTERADRIFIEIDRRLGVSIFRTETGLELRVYPRTEGLLWDEPFTTFQVDEAEIATLAEEMEDRP